MARSKLDEIIDACQSNRRTVFAKIEDVKAYISDEWARWILIEETELNESPLVRLRYEQFGSSGTMAIRFAENVDEVMGLQNWGIRRIPGNHTVELYIDPFQDR